MNTHLFAKKLDTTSDNVTLGLGRDNDNNTSYEYQCIISCRPKENALKEVLTHWSSYEENFEKLLKTGILICHDASIDASVPPDSNLQKPIIGSEKKLHFERVSGDKYIADLRSECYKIHGKFPEEKMIAMNRQGGPILGFFIDDKLIDPIGITIYYDQETNGQVIKLVNLRT